MQFNIYPINLLRSLSLALELSTGGLSRHHWRTAMVVNHLARHIGLDQTDCQTGTYAALLHDLGAASHWTEPRVMHEHLQDRSLYRHAERGYQLLQDSPQLKLLAEPIRHHHDWWDGRSPSGLSGSGIPILARVICIADQIEVLLHDKQTIYSQRDAVMDELRRKSGNYLDPDLVLALQDLGKTEGFWLDLSNSVYYENFFRQVDAYGRVGFDIDDVLSIAQIFATIIDSMSRFTATHSRGVSRVAAYLAQMKGYSANEIKMMRIAGLLHDLGKLAVPNEILEKPGKLTPQETTIIRQHPYYTYRILEQIDGISTIAEWAAFHHETLDGLGYPFRVKEDSLRLGSRIVAVADIFAALTEERPYRVSLSSSRVKAILESMVKNHKIDGNITADLFQDFESVRSLVDPDIST